MSSSHYNGTGQERTRFFNGMGQDGIAFLSRPAPSNETGSIPFKPFQLICIKKGSLAVMLGNEGDGDVGEIVVTRMTSLCITCTKNVTLSR